MSAHLRKINTVLVQLFFSFIAGVLSGTLLGSLSAPLAVESSALANVSDYLSLIFSLLWLPAAALMLSTSTLGHKLVPLLLMLRGYLLSASIAIFLKGGLGTCESLLTVGLPALFSVPAFFLLCEDAVSSSRIICLCSKSGVVRSCECIQPRRLLISIFLLTVAAAMQIYFVPLIV